MYHFWHFNDHKTPRVNMIAEQMTPFFSSTLWAVAVGIFHFCISGPSKFNSMLSFWYIIRADDTGEGGAGEGMAPTFLHSKKKKEKQRKKRKSFQVETIRSCFSHCRASRTQKFFLAADHGDQNYFLVLHVPSALKSISAAMICLVPNSITIWPWTIGTYLNMLQVKTCSGKFSK